MRDRTIAENSTWQTPTFTRDRHPSLCGIWTRNPNERAAPDPHLRSQAAAIGWHIKSATSPQDSSIGWHIKSATSPQDSSIGWHIKSATSPQDTYRNIHCSENRDWHIKSATSPQDTYRNIHCSENRDWHNTVVSLVTCTLYKECYRHSTLSSHNKLNLYKLLIRPILTYAAPVWSNTSSSNYRLLQILQSKCLRFFNQNFFEVLVSIPGELPSPTSIPLSILNLYTSLFTVCRKNFSTPAPLTQILSSAK